MSPIAAPQPFPSNVAARLQSVAPSMSSEGRTTVDSTPAGRVLVQIPLSKLERVRSIRLAGSDVARAEEVEEESAANREKLRKLAIHLASPRDQIALFGKELPQWKLFSVRVTE